MESNEGSREGQGESKGVTGWRKRSKTGAGMGGAADLVWVWVDARGGCLKNPGEGLREPMGRVMSSSRSTGAWGGGWKQRLLPQSSRVPLSYRRAEGVERRSGGRGVEALRAGEVASPWGDG